MSQQVLDTNVAKITQFQLRTKAKKFISAFRDEYVSGYIFWSSLGGSGLQPHIGRSNMDGRHSMPIVLSEYVMTRTQCLKIAPKSHIYLFMFNTLLDRDSVASLKNQKNFRVLFIV